MDVVPELLAALPALDAGLDPAAPWPLRRVELRVPEGVTVHIGDPQGSDGYAIEVPQIVAYLVLDADPDEPEITAALLRLDDACPVGMDEDVEFLDTFTGVLLVHALADNRSAVRFAQDFAEAGDRRHEVNPGEEATGRTGKPSESWQLEPDGPVLALRVNQEGMNVFTCRDAQGRNVGMLLHA
ncbi:hypothetical protein [Kitasatospora sp. NPDC017646]|uniref:hypothetical protein n=1 Tax=Kitasatospora sp. NPDC017646 TaxID=3364024 RepID=UPI003792E0BA